MNRRISCLIGSSFVILLLYFGLTENYKNSILNNIEIFAQENKSPVVKNSKIIDFSGVNYADVV
ncbi:MAG: hypothetical protein ACXWEW_03000, partial [Nitrososphaeraceae archaeon]